MGSCGVEVSQQGTVPFLGLFWLSGLGGVVSLCVDKIRNRGLNNEFGVSVWVGWAKRALLRNGYHVRKSGSVTIDGGRAGEDNVSDIMSFHCAQEAYGSVNVDVVVVEWLLAGFANGLFQKPET